MKQVLLFLLVSIIYTSTVAADASTPKMTIKVIETGWAANAVYITTNQGEKVEGCSSPRLRLDANSTMFDQDFSLLMSAYHAKSNVVFRVAGCSGNDMNVIAVALTN